MIEKIQKQYTNILETKYGDKKIWQLIAEKNLTVAPAFKGSLYDECKCKIMIVGRAINGWEIEFDKADTVSDVINLIENQTFEFSHLVNSKGFGSEDDNRKVNYFYKKSRFWQLVKKVLESYGESKQDVWYNDPLNWQEKVVWTNLYKVAPRYGGNPPWDLIKKNMAEYISILKLEIELYKPDRILFITDYNYIYPWKKEPSFACELGLPHFEGDGFVVSAGEYSGAKMVVCQRPDRFGTSTEAINNMVKEIKVAFDDYSLPNLDYSCFFMVYPKVSEGFDPSGYISFPPFIRKSFTLAVDNVKNIFESQIAGTDIENDIMWTMEIYVVEENDIKQIGNVILEADGKVWDVKCFDNI